ncbi:hypothetical protein OCH74_08330 [Bifidobacterium thermacidophilum]|uniref:DUF4190 domain-containing protein n=1 Tax=Bifidobacterium thermacidophilum TaxID=246618 RepID=A0ABW8KU95_9BIFI
MSEADRPGQTASEPQQTSGESAGSAQSALTSRSGAPEYGAMRSQFPADYNPYQFGRDDDDSGKNKRQDANSSPAGQQGGNTQPAMPWAGAPQQEQWPGSNQPQGPSQQYPSGQYTRQGPQNPNQPYGPYPYGPQGVWPQQGRNGTPLPGQPGYQPRYFNGIDVNDPASNPLYGRWDSSAIVSFVFALMGLPILPAILGAVSIWRDKTFHMKGRGFAIAAVIIDVIITVVWVWMLVKGITSADLYQMIGNQLYGGGSGSGTDSLSA